MAHHAADLDGVFAALADPTRRAILTRLGEGPATVGELAASASISLPSFLKHVRALEANGLVVTTKVGRVRRCELVPARLRLVDDWLAEQRGVWERRTDRLEALLTELDPQEAPDGP